MSLNRHHAIEHISQKPQLDSGSRHQPKRALRTVIRYEPRAGQEDPGDHPNEHAHYRNRVWRDLVSSQKTGDPLPYPALPARDRTPVGGFVIALSHAHFPIRNIPATNKAIPATFTILMDVP